MSDVLFHICLLLRHIAKLGQQDFVMVCRHSMHPRFLAPSITLLLDKSNSWFLTNNEVADFLQMMKYQHFTGRHGLKLHLKNNDRHKECALKTIAAPKSSLQLSNFLPSRLALFLSLLSSLCAVFAGFEINLAIYNLSIIGTKLLNPFTIKSFQYLENFLARN